LRARSHALAGALERLGAVAFGVAACVIIGAAILLGVNWLVAGELFFWVPVLPFKVVGGAAAVAGRANLPELLVLGDWPTGAPIALDIAASMRVILWCADWRPLHPLIM